MQRIAPIVLGQVVPQEPIFTTQAVARAARTTRDIASRALAQLASRGLIVRLKGGLWADPKHPSFSPYAVVPYLLKRRTGEVGRGYVSFLSALHLHGMLSQIPRAIYVAVADRRQVVTTPVATYSLHKLQPELLGGHAPGDVYGRFELAAPTKALFDTIYLSSRRGRQFAHLPEVDLEKVSSAEMRRWISKISHVPLQTAVLQRWDAVRQRDGASRRSEPRRPSRRAR